MYDAYATSEVAAKLPLEINSIVCQKSTRSLLAGSKRGDLLIYSPYRNGRRGYELDKCYKRFEKKAVLELALCDSMQILFCISDQQISAHDMSVNAPGYPLLATLNRIKPIQTFSIYENTEDSQLYIAVSSKKKIHLFKWSSDSFVDIQLECQQNFADNPMSLCWCGGNLAFSVKDEYFLMKMAPNGDYTIWSAEVKRLFNFIDNSIIVDLYDKMLVGYLRGEILTMASYAGTKTQNCTDLRFSASPVGMVYDSPYMIALLPKCHVEIRSVDPPMLIQSMMLNKANILANGNRGFVYVGGPSDLWILDSFCNIRKSVAFLVLEKNFQLAIQLADATDVFSDENKIEIKRQAALNLFNQKKFEESFTIHSEINTDVISVIQLFPDLLPDKLQKSVPPFDFPENDKKRAILALGNYLSLVRTNFARKLDLHYRSKKKESEGKKDSEGRMNREDFEATKVGLQVVDTTLLKCYIKTKPMLVDSLLRLHNNSCFFDDAEAILKKEDRLSSLFILYETRRKHELALELLRTEAYRLNPDPFFEGVERTVAYLQTLGNNNLDLIFKYAKWVLAKDIQEGLSIFTSDESELASNLDRDSVTEFLRKECVPAVIPYLEQIIFKWGEMRPKFHESLAEHYVARVKILLQDYVHAFPDDENIIRAGHEEGELGDMRRRLLKFLETSQSYSPQTILIQLSNRSFYEERALILGRLAHHEQALTIYTSILHDNEAAEKYCNLYYDREDANNSQVYLLLFRSFVCPSDPQVAGISERDLPIPPPDIQQAIRVLSRHADKINTVSALSLIPPDTPLRLLSKALNAVLQTTHDQATACSLRRSVCDSALSKCEARLRTAESVRINVNNTSECSMCKKKIGNSAFVRFPSTGCTSGSLVHMYCYEKSAEKDAFSN